MIEGEGRAFSAGGDLQTIGAAAANDTVAPVVGELLKHYHAFIETHPADAEDRRCPASTARPPAPAWASPSSPISASPPTTPAHAGLCQDRRLAGRRLDRRHGRHRRHRAARCRSFWPRTVLPRSRPMNGASSPASFPRRELKAETRKFAERLAQNPPAAIAGTKSLVYQAAVTPTKQQLDAEEQKIIDAMLTEDFRVAVKKFTSKAK